MIPFQMIRHNDDNGISGTGVVLDGVIFPNGRVVVCWKAGNGKSKCGSINIYDSIEDFEDIHVTHHPGNGTELVGYDLDAEVEQRQLASLIN